MQAVVRAGDGASAEKSRVAVEVMAHAIVGRGCASSDGCRAVDAVCIFVRVACWKRL